MAASSIAGTVLSHADEFSYPFACAQAVAAAVNSSLCYHAFEQMACRNCGSCRAHTSRVATHATPLKHCMRILESAAVPHLHCMHFQHCTLSTALLCHAAPPFEAVTNTHVQLLHSYTSMLPSACTCRMTCGQSTTHEGTELRNALGRKDVSEYTPKISPRVSAYHSSLMMTMSAGTHALEIRHMQARYNGSTYGCIYWFRRTTLAKRAWMRAGHVHYQTAAGPGQLETESRAAPT